MIKKSFINAIFCAATVTFAVQSIVNADDDDKPKCPNCGVVTAIQAQESSGGPGLGAAAGALAGGLIGNQAGKNDSVSSTVGGTAAAIIGAAGGALTGHYAEKAMRGNKEWAITVRMNSGETRTVNMKSDPNVQTGDRVTVAEGMVTRLQDTKKFKSDHDDDDKHEKDD